MDSTVVLVVVAVAIVAVVAIALWFFSRQQRQRHELREHFGPEYDRAVDEYGAEHKAADVLTARKERVEQLHLRQLSAEESQRLATEWRAVQANFVDNPELAVGDADRLVIEAMQNRGYPMGEFEQRAADVSVDHPQVVEHYRAAHALAQRVARGDAATEDMRQAMVHYRFLFEDLIETHTPMEASR